MMSLHPPDLQTDQVSTETLTSIGSPLDRRLFFLLGAVALVYAVLASLRTVFDPDLGWQMATGRWVAQHHHAFSTDVFSYTANGQPWIYPVGSGLLFYALYLVGGYKLLSWLGAAVCVATVALLLRRGSAFTAAIAILAVPLIAERSSPRADIFTMLLFAAYLSILWQHFQTGRAQLWFLPILMIAWVNLHLGFIAGLGLIAGFIGIDLLEMPFSKSRRTEAWGRMRRLGVWLALTAAATLLNPWGWGLYWAIIRQDRVTAQHTKLIAEWASGGWNWTGTLPSFAQLPMEHTLTLLMFVVVIAGAVALLELQFGAAILLLGAMYESMRHIRMQALTACIVVVVAGAVFAALAPRIRARIPNARVRAIAAIAMALLFVALAVLRSVNFVNDRNYVARYGLASFGTGPAWWLPQGAAEFVDRENLPGNIFNSYNVGGYLVWKLGLKYRDYIDGRAVPFGPEAIPHEERLLGLPIDSPEWQQEADRYNINTIILPVGLGEIAYEQIPDLCYSEKWTPVYLDELAIVLVRRTAQNQDLINRLQVNCANVPLPGAALGRDTRAFPLWVNTAYLLAVLNREDEALSAANNALAVFPGSARLHQIRGAILYAFDRRIEAEREWLNSIALRRGGDAAADAFTWSRLAELYEKQNRLPEAAQAWRRMISLATDSITASNMPLKATKAHAYVRLARIYILAAQPRPALQALDIAVQTAPSVMLDNKKGGRTFSFDVAQGRAAAWKQLGDLQQATSFEEEAVKLDPDAADAWSNLAKLYAKQGRIEDQHRAEARATALANP
jgi:tetratricopeptide (TPR) repeat protein